MSSIKSFPLHILFPAITVLQLCISDTKNILWNENHFSWLLSTQLYVHFKLSTTTSETLGSFPLQVVKEQRISLLKETLMFKRHSFLLCALLISQHLPSAGLWKDLMPWKQRPGQSRRALTSFHGHSNWILNCAARQTFKMYNLWVMPSAPSSFLSYTALHKSHWDRRKLKNL